MTCAAESLSAAAWTGTYQFTAVDGGCFNNDPVTCLHRDLAGLIGRNPREPAKAYRAMLMIDPLADQPSDLPPSGRSLLRVAEAVVGMFVSASRYLTADMDLFGAEDVFSRFQLVPTRPERGKVGEAALAGTALGALAGWGSRDFRTHDFLLGRANMQSYLRTELVLRADNSLFDRWTDALRKDHACDLDGNKVGDISSKTAYYLPILPVLVQKDEPLPHWPKGGLDPDQLQKPIEERLEAVLGQLRKDNFSGLVSDILGSVLTLG